MFANVMVWDDADFGPGEATLTEDSISMVREGIESLNGRTRTLVTLYRDDEAHITVGGDSASGLVVYATFDNQTFHQVVREAPDGTIRVVAGGQPGNYPASQVVPVDMAIQGAYAFARNGELADGLKWSVS